MARPKKPTNYQEELERIESRLKHHKNSILELEERKEIIVGEKTEQEMKLLSNYLSNNNLTVNDILSKLNLTA